MSYASLARFGVYNPMALGWVLPGDADLTQFSHSGANFGLMNRAVVPVFQALLDELVPLIPSKRLVAGQCGCYNPASRTVGGGLSFHCYGTAIDINWGSNPMYSVAKPAEPDSLPWATSALAKDYGCEWGGDWSYPQDWMHIECHLTPAQAAAVKPTVEQAAAAAAAPLANQPTSASEDTVQYTAFRDITTKHIYLAAPNYWIDNLTPAQWTYALARNQVIADPATGKPKLWDISHPEIGVQRSLALGSAKK